MKAVVSFLMLSILVLQVTATPGIGSSKHSSRPVGGNMNFVGCSSSQQKKIEKAAIASNKMIDKATSSLQGFAMTREMLASYATWFGPFMPPRNQRVLSYFQNMRGAATQLTYDCQACNNQNEIEEYRSHGYLTKSGGTYQMNICPKFWKLPIEKKKKSPSQAGILVQELSRKPLRHGEPAGYHAASRPDAERLAKTDPDRAVNNAPSLMYYAEDRYRA